MGNEEGCGRIEGLRQRGYERSSQSVLKEDYDLVDFPVPLV